ncbi:hypothetical protein EDB89DRAFT_1901977 [Lactarius sanguifluus]|nr:hypothetical protein EDB89DRAFT_1901977 [Lactarius sanguifluus]
MHLPNAAPSCMCFQLSPGCRIFKDWLNLVQAGSSWVGHNWPMVNLDCTTAIINLQHVIIAVTVIIAAIIIATIVIIINVIIHVVIIAIVIHVIIIAIVICIIIVATELSSES